MKRFVLACVILWHFGITPETSEVDLATDTGQMTELEREERKQKMIQYFSQVTQGAFNIALNPRDPNNLGSSIGCIVVNMICFVKEALKRGLPIDAADDEIFAFIDDLDEETKRGLSRVIKRSQKLFDELDECEE